MLMENWPVVLKMLILLLMVYEVMFRDLVRSC